MNRNYYQEFSPPEFERALVPYFSDLKLFGQRLNAESESYFFNQPAKGIEWFPVKLGVKHKISIRWRNYAREHITGAKVDTMIEIGSEIVEVYLNNCMYLIGCGVKA